MNEKRVVLSNMISEVRDTSVNHAPNKATPTLRKAKKPLIDIVNPQPKAFFAYLQMPSKSKKVFTVKRISRKLRGKK